MAEAIITWFVIFHVVLFLYGDAFLVATEPFRIFLIGITLVASSRVLSDDPAARGKPKLNFCASFIIVTINIVFNVLLIPKMCMIGATVATTSAYPVNFLIKIFLYQRVSEFIFRQLLLPNSLDNRVGNFIMEQVNGGLKCTS
ncbi:MAG: polysaccharide biosynthesis C-terminal domain-containing protein [Deltaproteobacteria bacterium]|jgi:O-antigen/teichoic acid export membrane protein|nr:polysaccharide biosynthesis C-terminal domain-containing protein [Deltaproteobacteria bacterium]